MSREFSDQKCSRIPRFLSWVTIRASPPSTPRCRSTTHTFSTPPFPSRDGARYEIQRPSGDTRACVRRGFPNSTESGTG